MLTGIVGGRTCSTSWRRMSPHGARRRRQPVTCDAVVVALVTFSIVVGRVGAEADRPDHAESVARFVAPPIQWLSLGPRNRACGCLPIDQVLLLLLGMTTSPYPSRKEIEAVLDEGSTAGGSRRTSEDRGESVQGSMTVHRNPDDATRDIASLHVDATHDEVIATMEAEPHSRYPFGHGPAGHHRRRLRHARCCWRAARRAVDLRAPVQGFHLRPGDISGRDTLERFLAKAARTWRSSSTSTARCRGW